MHDNPFRPVESSPGVEYLEPLFSGLCLLPGYKGGACQPVESLTGCVLKQPAKISSICVASDSGVIQQADPVLKAVNSFGKLELGVDELLHPGEKSAMES